MTRPTSLENIAGAGAKNVPPPPSRWLLRFGLPSLVIGLVVLILLITAWTALIPARSVQVATVAIRSVEISAEDLPRTGNQGSMIQAPGWIEPDPFPTYVAALEEGVVDEILKVEGDRVAVGEVVATLIDDEARILVAETEAALTLALSQQESASMILEKAMLELTTRSEEIRRVDMAEALVEQLRAEATELDAETVASRAMNAQLDDELSRKSGLVEQGAVAEAVVIRLEKQLEAGKAKTDSLLQQRKAMEARIDAAQAELDAARTAFELQIHETIEVEMAKSRLVETAALINSAQAERDRARLAFNRCKVTSPVAGTVIELLTSPGSTVNYGTGPHGSHILHVYDPEHLQVRADIPLADAARVRVGQPANIVVDVLPDTVFSGRITRFLHKADISKNTIEAKVVIDDPSPLLKPEMLARVRIMPMTEGDEHGSGASGTVQRVFVPEDAIVRSDDLSRIWVIEGLDRGKGRAELRTIILGEGRNDGWVEVTRGMQPGDKVILDAEDLNPGDHVRISNEREV
jgi:HlyD family secretion protein